MKGLAQAKPFFFGWRGRRALAQRPGRSRPSAARRLRQRACRHNGTGSNGGFHLAASETSHTASPSLWAELRAALRGTNADYTRIPLRRAVLLLAVPMMLELVLESTFAVVDIFFVAASSQRRKVA